MTCGAAQLCVAGTCQDKCSGAACPGKASCVDGKCQPPLALDPTGMAGSNVGGAFSLDPLPTAGTLNIAGLGGTGGSSSNPEAPNGNPILKSGESATGCNCRVGVAPGSARWGWLSLAALTLLGRRRRRA
jgi:MYXO-CTERM domain-containing protein